MTLFAAVSIIYAAAIAHCFLLIAFAFLLELLGGNWIFWEFSWNFLMLRAELKALYSG